MVLSHEKSSHSVSDEPTKGVPIQRSEKSRSSSHEGRRRPRRPPRLSDQRQCARLAGERWSLERPSRRRRRLADRGAQPSGHAAGGQEDRRPDARVGQGGHRHSQQLFRESVARAQPGAGGPGSQSRPTRPPWNKIRTEETTKIQKLVAGLLPAGQGRHRSERIGHDHQFPRHQAGRNPPARHRPESARLAFAILEHAGHDRPGRWSASWCCGR